MGKFFDELFNKRNSPKCNCHHCRMGSIQDLDVEETIIDIELEDPEEVILDYFDSIKEADSEEEVIQLLTHLFNEAAYFGQKEGLLSDIQLKVDMLNFLENGSDE